MIALYYRRHSPLRFSSNNTACHELPTEPASSTILFSSANLLSALAAKSLYFFWRLDSQRDNLNHLSPLSLICLKIGNGYGFCKMRKYLIDRTKENNHKVLQRKSLIMFRL